MESIANREIFIVHLDDHHLIREGFKKYLQEYLPNLQIEGFENNEQALEFIENCLINKRRIDFVITDIKHPGEDGIVFAKKFRALARAYEVRIPLIAITMIIEILNDSPEKDLFDVRFPKNVTAEEIISFLEQNITT
jgi:DNA-binding NarL/FixJ family response regulator